MHPLTQSKKSIIRPLLIALGLVCFAVLPRAQAVVPAPDGGYPGNNTAEGSNALLSLTTGINNTAVGANALLKTTDGGYNAAFGSRALENNVHGLFNMAVGTQALFKNTADANMAVGFRVLYNNTLGNNLTGVGAGALFNNTTGNNNTAIGAAALSANTTGAGNTAIGRQALFSNTTGGYAVAVGYQALASNIADGNTATGYQALQSNNTGPGNTAVGARALLRNTSGPANTAVGAGALGSGSSFTFTGNTAIGAAALANLQNGYSNIALGDNAGYDLSLGTYNIHIGNRGVDDDSSTIRIGDSILQHRAFIAGIRDAQTEVADAVNVVIDSAGQLGTTSSSRRFKKEIKPMDRTSEAILGLKPVTFYYKSDSSGTRQFGLIAEEVAAVNPDLVVRDKEGKPYTVRYEAVNAMLLNEFLKEHHKVEEQNRKMQEQEETITQLKKDFRTTVAELNARLKEQDSKIEKVNAQLEVSKTAPQIVLNNQ